MLFIIASASPFSHKPGSSNIFEHISHSNCCFRLSCNAEQLAEFGQAAGYRHTCVCIPCTSFTVGQIIATNLSLLHQTNSPHAICTTRPFHVYCGSRYILLLATHLPHITIDYSITINCFLFIVNHQGNVCLIQAYYNDDNISRHG